MPRGGLERAVSTLGDIGHMFDVREGGCGRRDGQQEWPLGSETLAECVADTRARQMSSATSGHSTADLHGKRPNAPASWTAPLRDRPRWDRRHRPSSTAGTTARTGDNPPCCSGGAASRATTTTASSLSPHPANRHLLGRHGDVDRSVTALARLKVARRVRSASGQRMSRAAEAIRAYTSAKYRNVCRGLYLS